MKLSLKHYSYIFIFGLIALIPGLLLFNVIRKFAVNVPYGDEWVYVPLIAKMHAGQVTWHDVWAQHNEHRIGVPRLLTLGLAQFQGWDTTLETYASFSLAVLTWLLLQRLLAHTLPASRLRLLPPLMAVMALLIFSFQQGQSWLWGFQVCWFLSNFFVILTISATAFWRGQWRGILIAALTAIGATYSLAAGQLVWGVVLISLLLDRGAWRPSLIIFWLIAMLLTIGTYFYAYHSNPNNPSALLAFQHPFNWLYYISAYLGSPFGLWGVPSPFYLTTSAVYGLAGLIGIGIATTWLWKAQPQSRAALLPWLQLVLFAGASAVLTGMGRITMGVMQSLSSHYVTISILFWIGLSVIGVMAGPEFFSRQPQWRWSGGVLAVMVISLVLIGYLRTAIKGALEIETVGVDMKTGLAALYHSETALDNSLVLLKREAHTIRSLAQVLEDLNEGPFSSYSQIENQRRLQEDGWGTVLNSERYGHSAYSAALFQIGTKDTSMLTRLEDTLIFSNANPASSFYLDLTKAQQPWPIISYPFLHPPVLDIQSKNALYLHLYWNTGRGLNESERSTVYGLESPDGWKHFRHSVWPGAKGFRVDLHYATTEPISDSLKIELYQSH